MKRKMNPKKKKKKERRKRRTCFGADGSDISASRVRAQARQQLVADATSHRHRLPAK
jgi:hypothetical protein